jgi:glycosyltransferase involved in cell wall biosynthesis
MTVIFIYHEHQNYGAGAALNNLESYHRKQGIPTALLYLYDIKDLSFLNRYKDPVVVCNTIISYPLVQALSTTNVPTYWYIHEWIDETHNWLNFFNPNIFNTKIMPIFVCNKSFENYKQRIPQLNKHMIIYNSISKDLLKTKAFQFKVPRPDVLTIAIIGSIEERKNQQAFIDNVYSKLGQVHLILVGRIIKQIRTNANIQMTNHVDNAIPYIMAADIIVSYSLNEVLPMHIIESFYCKKPVISTNVGGVSEMIEDGVNGFLIDINDAPACISRINDLKDATLREKIGEAAHNTFLTKFEAGVTCKLLN